MKCFDDITILWNNDGLNLKNYKDIKFNFVFVTFKILLNTFRHFDFLKTLISKVLDRSSY